MVVGMNEGIDWSLSLLPTCDGLNAREGRRTPVGGPWGLGSVDTRVRRFEPGCDDILAPHRDLVDTTLDSRNDHNGLPATLLSPLTSLGRPTPLYARLTST